MKSYDDYIDLLMQKDEKAFAYIYNETKNGVFAVIIAIVKDQYATEDLMQETYIKMLTNLNQYKKGRNFNAWIVQIAKNLAIDYYRKNKNLLVRDVNEDEFVYNVNVDSKPKNNEDLESIIKVLNEEERQIILLHIVSDMKFREISSVVNKPLGTVLWIYNKSLKKIKKDLERKNYEQ